MHRTITKRPDENTTEGLTKQVKKMPVAGGTTAAEAPKRTALGILSNRVELRATVKDTNEQKSLKDTKQNALRAVKARVDTHWKKPVTNAEPANKQTTTGRGAAVTAGGTSGVITRSVAQNQGNAAAAPTSKIARPMVNTRTTAEQKAKAGEPKESKVKVVGNKTTAKTENATSAVFNDKTNNLQRKDNANPLLKLKSGTTATAAAAAAATVNPQKVKTTTINNIKQQLQAQNTDIKKSVANTESRNDIKTINSNQKSENETVRDIDKDDGQNLLLISEYVNDIYKYLNELEEAQQINEDYLKEQVEVTSRMRGILIDWINEVQVQFHLLDETFQMAVGLIDRYLQIIPTTKRKLLQLVGVTALFIAVKYEELLPPAIVDFVYITDEAYTSKQIFEMEMEMLKTLDYSLSRPLPINFLRRFAKAAGSTENVYEMAKYFVELALLDYATAHYKPSKMSAAALLLSLCLEQCKTNPKVYLTEGSKCWTATLKYYTHYEVSDLWPLTQNIALMARNAPDSKLKSIFNKYKGYTFHKLMYKDNVYNCILDEISTGTAKKTYEDH